MREVIHLGSRVEDFDYPMGNRYVLYHEPSIPQPGNKPLFLKPNFLSGRIPLSCESLSQSDVRNCNMRIVNGEVGNISEGMWRSMKNLGITNISNKFDLVSGIKEMERKESKGGGVNKGVEIGFL